ncbi:peptidase inhibitor family I36 protein [Streptomyces sp. MB09-01]|uniref:peptidase inhibitor family I36 protein n=1 Tax=Streptomyces sp. MB09-01 TaxID=3028666 RepID=UPI0029B86C76|nr:peptidase inhibitor family I36 protein [Streptomyces sp. MB09-01]MDX3534513.1 peptidase inhibitor family I36 protein [Streptomyces sp. MB09-01]
MRSKIVGLLFALVATLGLGLMTAAPATAGTGACASGNFCAWYLTNYDGPSASWSGNDANWSDNYLSNGANIDNDDRSWRNNGTSCAGCDHVRIYDGYNYSGQIACLHFGDEGWYPNANPADRGSSHRWGGEC